MRCAILGLVLALGGGSLFAGTTPLSAEEETLREAGHKSDGPAILKFFQQRTVTEAERARLAKLVRQLGASTYAERERASKELVAAGGKGLVPLRLGVADADREIARRSRRCLARIDVQEEDSLLRAAVIVLRQRKPAGAVAILLAFLPSLRAEHLAEEIFTTIEVLVSSPSQPQRVLLDAVTAKHPRQRSAAAWVLGRSAQAKDRDRIVPLLRDESPGVRFQAAMALVSAGDRRGVEPLIDSLTIPSIEQAEQAEELLRAFVADRAPVPNLEDDGEQRKRCQGAWRTWYRDYGVHIDRTKIEVVKPGRRLRQVVFINAAGTSVWAYGADRRQRLFLGAVGRVNDVRALPGGRVLLAENCCRVSERDSKGTLLWEVSTGQSSPVAVQRLPGGNTLIATSTEIREVTREKKVTYSIEPFLKTAETIRLAQKLPGGNLVCILTNNIVVEVDHRGKEIYRFPIEETSPWSDLVVLPNGRYLLPYFGKNRIDEVDRRGKVQRRIPIPSPWSVAVLPGGNLLVSVGQELREIDARGKVLWRQQMKEESMDRVRVR